MLQHLSLAGRIQKMISAIIIISWRPGHSWDWKFWRTTMNPDQYSHCGNKLSYLHWFSTILFSVPVRWHLCIELGPGLISCTHYAKVIFWANIEESTRKLLYWMNWRHMKGELQLIEAWTNSPTFCNNNFKCSFLTDCANSFSRSSSNLQWLGVIRQHAIIWINDDRYVWWHMAPLVLTQNF